MKFDQEDFYQLILKEQWTDILELLHTNKKIISSDPMLQNAAEIFEQEFFKKVSEYPIERKDIDENLETLLLLKAGRFYTLSSNNYKTLIIELVKRKPLKNAYDYAKEFPDEEICKTTINQYELLIAKEEGSKLTPLNHLPENWIEIYNRLFELINIPTDVATYFSGPRFINTVREFEPYFPDYAQFIENRTRENKSTTRKIFYYDILLGIRELTRIKVVERILEILKPYQLEKVESIYKLLGRNSSKTETNRETESKKEEIFTPSVFISYSWDDELHKQWVLELAGRLSLDGISVILDRYYLKPGKSLPHFVENSIAKANRIIIIFTPNYKLKADHRTGGAGYEYSIMNIDLYNNQTKNDKIIPVLRSGSVNESIPSFMQQFIHIDFQNDNNFENSYLDLLREIYNEPEIQKPQIGAKPLFKKKSSNEMYPYEQMHG